MLLLAILLATQQPRPAIDSVTLIRALEDARRADSLGDTTLAGARDRAVRWRAVLLVDSSNAVARAAYDRATADLARATDLEAALPESTAAKAAARQHLVIEAQDALQHGRWREAELLVGEALLQDTLDPGARSLLPAIERARARDERRQTKVLGALGLALLTGLTLAAAWLISRRNRRRDRTRNLMLQVTDGSAHPRVVHVPATTRTYRIGSARGTDNDFIDLILDGVAPHHATIVRRGGQAYVTPGDGASITVDGQAVAPGAEREIVDGNDIRLGERVGLHVLWG